MASLYFRVEILKAADGDLPTGLAAYISRSSLRSAVTGERFERASKKKDLVYTEVMLPPKVDLAFKNPERLWSAMERAEIRKGPKRTGAGKLTKAQHQALLGRIDDPAKKRLSKAELAPAWRDDAQLAYHIVLACPHEFSEQQITAMVRDFIEQELRPHGLIVQFAVHRPDEKSPLNWHAHLLAATRKVSGTDVGKKIRGVFADFANKEAGKGFVSEGGGWPDRWAAFQLDYARKIGIEIEIPAKSATPEPHQGKAYHLPESDIAVAWAEAKADSRNAIQEAGVLPELLAETRATFTADDARAVLQRHNIAGGAADAQIAALKDSPELVPLFDRRDGRFSGRFTTRTARNQEMRIRQFGEILASQTLPDPLHRQLAQEAIDLTRRLKRPKRQKLRLSLGEWARPAGLAILTTSTVADSTLLALDRLARRSGARIVHLAPKRTIAGRLGRLSTPIASALRRQADRTDPAWDKGTSVFVHDADLLGADLADRLLCKVAKAGARLTFLSRSTPRHALGRNGAFAILDDLFMPRVEPDEGQLDEVDDWPYWITPSPSDFRQSSLALAASGDPRPSKTRNAVAAAQYHAPRPWRWPGAGIGDVLNLSCRSDCDQIFTRLTFMAAEEALAVYKVLPKISDSSSNPNSHPLAALRRSLQGHLRKVGLDPVRGREDLNCFKFLALKGGDRMRHLPELAPRRGYVDVRSLLANIDSVDLADWQEIAARMAHFCRGTFAAIRDSLHDLASNHPRESIQHAVSVALAQVYVIAKDAGQDLVPDTDRNDIWSLIPSAERIQRALRYDDHDGTIAPSLAFSLPTFMALNPQAKLITARRVPSPPQHAVPQICSRSIPRAGAAPQLQKPMALPSVGPLPAPASPNTSAHPTRKPVSPSGNLVALCLDLIAARDRSVQKSLAEQIILLPRHDGTQTGDKALHDVAMDTATYLRATPLLNPMALASYLEIIRVELQKLGYSPLENDLGKMDDEVPREPPTLRNATPGPGAAQLGRDRIL